MASHKQVGHRPLWKEEVFMISVLVWVPPKADPEARIQVQVVYLGKASKGVEKCYRKEGSRWKVHYTPATLLNDWR